ncbi:FAD-dependent monooxygenase [Nocardia sp. NPDC059240]|uniref:FAD-dependent monooxygenase n=1 Tax=Nocardia sp. NPDC059240 TaxID=3346786 RepID=UPI003677687C
MTTGRPPGKTVLISGAGIAGLALAFWLRRYGFRVTVVEQCAGPRTGGYKVDIRGAAMEVIARMGLLADVRWISTAMRGGDWVDRTGKRLATLGPGLLGLRTAADEEVQRGDLVSILFEATRADVEYVFADSIAGLDQSDTGVRVRFENSGPRVFDLVIGADGTHSATRRAVFGPEPQFARPTGLAVCVFSVPNELGLDHWELVHPTPGHVVQLYSARHSPAKAQFIFPAPEVTPDRNDVAAQRRAVAEAFQDAGWEVPRLLDAMPEARDFFFEVASQIRMDRWHSGRVALVGDAAWSPSPSSGQGAGMALVGAYVLAGELAVAGNDYLVAYARYDSKLRDYITANLDLGRKIANDMVAATPGALRMHVEAIRVMRYLPWKGRALRSIRKPLVDAANAIRLEDY